MRADLDIISQWIRPGSRVLDLGCGDGALLAYLREHRQVSGYGLEIDETNIISAIRNGVNVIHADLEAGLPFLPDRSVDEIHCRSFLEHIENFEHLFTEMVRVLKDDGRACIFVPHFSNPYYYSDYSHKRPFGLYTFYYFAAPERQFRR